MDFKQITADLSVSPQISPADLAEIRDQGFRTIICNRPDNEEAGQPLFEEIEAAAQAAGVQAHYIPVTGSPAPNEAVSAFREALQNSSGPVLAYCRSGARSSMLWSLVQAQGGSAA